MRPLAAVFALVLAACGAQPLGDAAAPPADFPAAEAPAIDAWVGRWTGPEGLFLEVGARDASGAYPITLKDTLDSRADYLARPGGEGLSFVRAGQTVQIRPGVGADTGFKYLADKRDCLILVQGREGYCRD